MSSQIYTPRGERSWSGCRARGGAARTRASRHCVAIAADAHRGWGYLADPSLRAQERLFFEFYAQALLGRPGTEGFLDEAVEGWSSPVRGLLIDTGIAEEAAVLARSG